MCQNSGNDAVRYSRTGDVFHYRWVALKCLDMINPLSNIDKIVVENSQEKMAGEYVIDVSEYLNEGNLHINYYQMKHTVKEKEIPATISFFKKTLEGFAKRYIDLRKEKKHKNVTFYVITNRKIDIAVKDNIQKKAQGVECSKHFDKYIKQYTALDKIRLRDFCNRLVLVDGCGDYEDLWFDLYVKTNYLLVGQPDETAVDKLESMVRKKALPKSNGNITKEEVLKCLGYPSEEFLFPAPQMLENIKGIVDREVYKDIMEKIANKDKSIVHASGGVGKSIFSQYIKRKAHGEVVIYDCFGLGTYRNRSKARHGFKVALTQIISELASMGLCDFMLISGGATPDEIMRMFLQRVAQACECIRKRDGGQKLYLLIDAADNAEMAADEYKEPCFVHELLRESVPEGCCLVMMCRTERKYMLKPSKEIADFELLPFSESEVKSYLKNSNIGKFSNQENFEIFRLTGGNPRVIANAVSFGKSKKGILAYLGPKGTNVNQQIEFQLKRAVDNIKETLSEEFQQQINSICLGLSVLPPFIPISVLAQIANVDESSIKSFVADMGRAFWLTDDNVIQFRDEPVETWFKENYAPEKEIVKVFADRIKRQAKESVYVAEVLPMLYLYADCLDELIALAFDEEGYPEKDKFDSRNVKLLRYKYAFRGALKAKKYTDTVKIAFLTAKETAGNQRLYELLKKNVDLVALFSEKNVVQEIAFSRILRSRWQGSENVYISSLLSGFPECKGEVTTYLRASGNWIGIYLDEQKKDSNRSFGVRLENEDISELGYAAYNYGGIECVVHFFEQWIPKRIVFEIISLFISRLVDQGKFSEINEFAIQISGDPYGIMAVCNELDKVGKSVQKDAIVKCWNNGINELWDERLEYNRDDRKILEGLTSFIEQSIDNIEDNSPVIDLVKKVVPVKAGYDFLRENYSETKSVFLRGRAIKKYLGFDLEQEDWLPDKKEKETANKIMELLFPLYAIRLDLLLGIENIEIVSQCSGARNNGWMEMLLDQHNLLNDVAVAHTKILLAGQSLEEGIVRELLKCIQNIKLYVEDEITFLRGIVRNEKLHSIWEEVEQGISERLQKIEQSGENVNELPEWYLLFSRALLAGDPSEAHAYFNLGIESISGLSEEIVSASKQMIEICEKSAESYHKESMLANQFGKYMEKVYDALYGDWSGKRAIQACIKLSPADGLAIISRFRDVDERWVDWLFEEAVEEFISTGYLSPSEGWALSAFMPDKRIKDFSQKCSEYEVNHERAVWIKESGEKYCQMIMLPQDNNVLGTSYSGKKLDIDNEKVEEAFKDINLLSQDGLKELLVRIDGYKNSKIAEAAYEKMFSKVTRDKRLNFLNNLIDAQDISFNTFLEVIKYVPKAWTQQLSIQRESNRFVYKICSRWCWELLGRYRRQQFVENMPFDVRDNQQAFEGFMDGLALVEDLSSHNQYIEYISVAMHYLTSGDAKEILEFALNMMLEKDENKNGKNEVPYRESDYPTGEKQLAGFLYAALGSPVAQTRWEAVHAVIRLAKMKCTEVLQELVNYDTDVSGVFIGQEYVHYKLHSILYLLIALYRIAKEDSDIVIPFKEKLIFYASEFMEHALIQRIALEIIKLVYQKRNSVFEMEEYDRLMSIAVSNYPVIDKEKNAGSGDNEDKESFYFGYDMTRYWFGDLGRVFGVSGKYVAERVAKVITEQWEISSSGTYKEDPRKNMWEDSAYRERIYHSHGSYPSVDTYNFYLSYHGMMVVAAQLLQEKPTVKGLYDEKNPWEYWIKRHLLSKNDGYLLSDMREEIPHDIEMWYAVDKNELWMQNPDEKDFMSQIVHGDEMCINGYWMQKDGNYQEEVRIASALVFEKSAEALVCTLMGYEDSNDYKLPEYLEDEEESNISPFILKGLVKSEYHDSKLDGFDPWAGNVQNCTIEIGEEYKKFLCAEQQRMQCWSFQNENENMNGARLLVSQDGLKGIVKNMQMLIILEVQITRNHTYHYKRDDYTYRSPVHRIYLFNGEDIIYGEI